MALYIDSAIYDEAALAINSGWVYGITTNPALLAKSGTSYEETYNKLATLDAEEIYYQVRSTDISTMTKEMGIAKEILGDKLVVKIPPTEMGFEFTSQITSKYKTCLTAIFTPAQALVAREAGADYIAIYVNRATKLMGDGVERTRVIAEVLDGSGTEIIAASLKSTDEVVAAYRAGAHHLTMPYTVLSGLIDSDYSQQAVDQFDEHGAHF